MLVERGRELSSLTSLLDRLVHGLGGLIVISGSLGMGKSELLLACAEQAAQAGAVLLTAVGSSSERSLPYGILAQLSNSPAGTPTMAELARRLQDGVNGDRDGHGTRAVTGEEPVAPREAAVLDLLWTELRRVAEGRPVLIGVDDVHFADPLSRQALLYFLRRSWPSRTLFVISESADAWPGHSALRSELLRMPHRCRLRVRPLSAAGVAEVVRAHVGMPPPSTAARAYRAATGGNPLFLRALLDDDHVQGDVPAWPSLPEDLHASDLYTQAVLACVNAGAAPMAAVARGLAVLGDATGLDRVLDLDTPVVELAVRRLTSMGVLDGARFRHPAARAALLDDLPPRERARLHRRAGQLLYERGAPATDVARHVLAAGGSDEPWAGRVLVEAAAQASTSSDLEGAVAALELAAGSARHAARRAELTASMARLEWRANPAAAARHLSQLTAAVHAGQLSGSDTAELVGFLLWHGQLDEAGTLLASPPGPDVTRADLAEVREWSWMSFPSVAPERSRALAGSAAGVGVSTADAAGRRPPARTSERAMLLESVVAGRFEQASRAAERLLDGLELDDAGVDSAVAALAAMTFAERYDRASYWATRLAATMSTSEAPTWRARVAAVSAELAFRKGDLPAARRLVDEAFTHVPPHGWGVVVGLPLATQAATATAMGDYLRAAQAFAVKVPETMYETRFGLHYLHARGTYNLSLGRARAALGDFLACAHRMRSWDLDHPALVPWRTAAAEAYLRLGDPDQARGLAQEQLARFGGRSRGLSLRLMAALSPGPRRAPLLEEAADVFAQWGDRLQLAWTLADLDRAYRELGNGDEARHARSRAMRVADACHAAPVVQSLLDVPSADPGAGRAAVPRQPVASGPDRPAKAAAGMVPPAPGAAARPVEPARPGGGAPATRPAREDGSDAPARNAGLDALSTAEQRVAFLAALGHSNREIATCLFITVSTVEQHLTRVYRKLDVRSRKELTGAVPTNEDR
ncbi:AAA family ATPase [Pseudofrankia inefficax]|uniref:AAA family ATPase n=1 Tax=Pseudofrankia inefficax (strain DSM 45817 / CECT 9037 / DDB 130130 / EuI1c) TaxID=298654 RepID=UPI0002E169C0|nr:LuxR family transcriptional regulator [Pseudofrankia inefficax]